jgi:Family of unknown function (DUF6338)
MPEFKGTENFYLILAFVVPGVIALAVRSMFITGRNPKPTENLLTFLVLSLVYYSFIVFLLQGALSVKEPWTARVLIWILLFIIGPAIFGFVLGVAAQKEWAAGAIYSSHARLSTYPWYRNWLDLKIIHAIPTAWDWRFSKVGRDGVFIMVTLTNEVKVAGYFGHNSFASTDAAERDLYLEEEYDVTDGRSAQGQEILSPRSVRPRGVDRRVSPRELVATVLVARRHTEVTSPSIAVKHRQLRSNEVPNPLPKRSGVLRFKQGLLNNSVVEILE